MFARVLLTAASLIVASVGALLVDCSSQLLGSFSGDPLEVCALASSYGVDGGQWVGFGLCLFALLALAITWVPALRPGHKRRLRTVPEHTLKDNLSRIAETSLGASDVPRLSPDEAVVADFTARVDLVEMSMHSTGTPTREVTERWMGLLHEANRLHNEDRLGTDDFARLNTRLLDLVAEPVETTGAGLR